MIDKTEARKTLDGISSALLPFHKALLHYQKMLQEHLEQKTFTPLEVLNLSMTHENFVWLRALSALIIQIDEGLYDKKTDVIALHAVVLQELRNLFLETGVHIAFQNKLAEATSRIPSLKAAHTELLKMIQR